MIIVDFSGTIVAAIMSFVYLNPDVEINEDRIRLSVLSSLKNYRATHKTEYGNLIVACDGKNYWRKEIFPYYKIKRKVTRDEGTIDWTKIYPLIDKIKEEIKKYSPYAVIEVDRAEADDVIASLVQMETTDKDKVLIISRDKDLKQLQKYPWVRQYNPVDKRWEDCSDPRQFLLEHIIKGDTGDSIPNIFSSDNSIAVGQRQKPVTQKRLAGFISKEWNGDALEARFSLNEKLIDLECIPQDIVFEILKEYEKQINKDKRKLLFYLTSHGLDKLAASLQDF